MKKRKWNLLLMAACLLAALTACRNAEKPFEKLPKTDPDLLWSYAVRSVGFVPRHSGSEAIVRYGNWIAETARESSFPVTEQRFTQRTPGGEIPFRNIVVTVPGKSSSWVLVGAHYDAKKFLTVRDFQAANDGASGVAALLGMIHALRQYGEKPPVTIRFVFFDGEECLFSYSPGDGLHGSRKAAQLWADNGDLKKCKGMILLDMVGDKELNFTLPRNTSEVFRKAFTETVRNHFRDLPYRMLPYDILDDHVPFLEKKIPVIDLIDFEYGPNNSYWHTAADTLDKISPHSIALAADLAFGLIWKAASF